MPPNAVDDLAALQSAVKSPTKLILVCRNAEEELARLRVSAGEPDTAALRRHIIAHSLYAVDLSPTAVRLAGWERGLPTTQPVRYRRASGFVQAVIS